MFETKPVPRLRAIPDRGHQWRTVARAAEMVLGGGAVLPPTELSGFHGYPIVEWSPGAADRLQRGFGPMLDRPTLSLWESWPADVGSSPPPPPLTIVGFASTASWRHALRAARELRGFGATFVVTDTWPSSLRLAEADISGVYVIATRSGEVDVLVQGRRTGGIAPRMVATRYWEERIFAHALEIGAPIPGCVPNRQPNESQGEMAVVTENHNAQNAPPGHAGRIRALSVRRPYANLIMSGHKRIENRSWGTEYRGVTAIHAGQKWEATGAALAHTFGAKGFAASANCPTGYLGTARLEDVHPAEGCRDRECEFWGVIEPGMFHWVFIDPAPFAVPIPGPGRLSLYLAPDSVRPAPRPA